MTLTLIKLAAVLIAAIVIGNQFTEELRKTQKAGLPIYKAYLSFPGLVIIVTVLGLPLLMWWFNR